MTKCQQLYLTEMNKILSLCYLQEIYREDLIKILEMQRYTFDYRIKHLVSKGFVTKKGYKDKIKLTGYVKEYPIEVYRQFCYDAATKHLVTKEKNVPEYVPEPEIIPKSNNSLGCARYVHKMEDYADKYKKQAERARQEYVRKPVFVGNLWSAIV